jgi:hypothetical protein
MRFALAYELKLDGKQAAWAAKKYKGHRTLPPREVVAEMMAKATAARV